MHGVLLIHVNLPECVLTHAGAMMPALGPAVVLPVTDTSGSHLGGEAESAAACLMDAAILAESVAVAQKQDAATALRHLYRPIWGMTCTVCAADITELLSSVPGVESVDVNPATQWLHLSGHFTGTDDALVAQLNTALAPLGYSLLDDNEEAWRRASQRSVRRSLFRLLVAALIWMQVMMYAWPEYSLSHGSDAPAILTLQSTDGLSGQDRALLRWAQWMLCLPLMLFCAQPVIGAAWQQFKQRRPTLDWSSAFAMLAAFAVSTHATFTGVGPVWFDSLSMFVLFLLLARHAAEVLRHHAMLAVLATHADLPARVERVSESGQSALIARNALHVGDRIRIRQGDVVPADATLLVNQALVSEAVLTGEDRPVLKREGDALMGGSRLLSADVQARVSAIGHNSTVGHIQQQLRMAATQRPEQTGWHARLSLPLLLAIVAVSGLSSLWASTQPALSAWWVGLSVLMVSCPCAISLAIPSAWTAATIQLQRTGLLVKRMAILDEWPDITDVVFDKTGTLTAGERVVQCMWLDGSVAATAAQQSAIVQLLADLSAMSLHPLSRAVLTWAKKAGVGAASPVWQKPVVASTCDADSTGLLSSGPLSAFAEHVGLGVQATDSQGRSWRMGSVQWCHAEAMLTARGLNDPDLHATVVLARQTGPSAGWIPVCLLRIESELRLDAMDVVQRLQADGLRIHLWSGDSSAQVRRVAHTLGIADVRSQQSPSDKYAAIRTLQGAGRRVLFIGDGLNDGPTLAAADISIALQSGSRLSAQQADAVLTGSHAQPHLAVIADGLQLSQRLQRITRQSMAWSLLYNAVAVPLAATGFFTPLSAGVGMAASALLVTLNALRLLRAHPQKADTPCVMSDGVSTVGISAHKAV